MRHLMLALMIALLPIRGWVGDVMATEMASHKPAQLQDATEMLAAHAYGTGAEGHFDHLTAAASSAQPAADCAGHGAAESGPVADVHCDSCTVCQACHTVALSPLIPAGHAVMAAPALPRAPPDHFASAFSALGQKPPIF